MASSYTLVSKTSDSSNDNMEINDNDDFDKKKRHSRVSLCSDNFRIVNGKIPVTLVAIQTISLMILVAAVALSGTTTFAFWNDDIAWKLEIRDEPSYIFFARTFLLFSFVTGLFGTFLSILGTGMVCCKDQINLILSKEKYFEIDEQVRTTFRNGICLFVCWGVMALYAIGTSLYIFSAFLVCSPNLKPKKMRYTSVQTIQEEKMITKIHSRMNLVDQGSSNNLELRQQMVQEQDQHQCLLPGERHGAREITPGPPQQQQRNKMPRAYSPVYPEYVEEIKSTQDNTPAKIPNPPSINRANFDTSSIPSRSQNTEAEIKRFRRRESGRSYCQVNLIGFRFF
ncbi:Oidioi.mRNA.OKI2018_I69.chr1.g2180.t3.cds [Oikopleura dioica]|uniref:Oidioi.mRNA.OKI2018_I69.chr1.g2180.t3.cds n=1 Tax=Oikopleura dioica TaxID=34765 RepID=A0ABN7SS04_OIKDI|nr:Oidioi.mRNA.OKI2018_I69.chr1.g2180.t3.cds [Oikopleura dioica]